MNADRYKKIKEIFQSVLDVPVEKRSIVLDEKCGHDLSMRAEVRRLLTAYDTGFLEGPAFEALALPIAENDLQPDSAIGHYTIVNKIGSGGMGDVYLAQDQRLGRSVAVKLLPAMFTDDADRLSRFQQEARAVSALNHPNILTIHEIGETDSTHYIATEYIDGETLRAKLNRGNVALNEALDIAIQCASALAAAHENGIIHRDIKPENIMLRRDNLVKVLDFGLAKLVEQDGVSIADDAPEERYVKTAPGVIMGTVQYMSPEQTRGHATDARTDIWSLGTVIYEMVTGRPAITGENAADLIAEIVKTHPAPPSQIIDGVPERLDEIVSKTLEKNPDERYQTANELLIDLKRLRRKLDLEIEIDRGHASPSSEMRFDTHGRARSTGDDVARTDVGSRNTVSSAEYILSTIRQHKKIAFITGAVVLSAVIVSALGLWRVGIFTGTRTKIPFESTDISRITNSGKSGNPALSPDGRFVAFVNSEVLEQSIIIRQIATGSEVTVVPPQNASGVWGLKFSPDADYLYYLVTTNLYGILYRVPTFGGTPKKIAEDADSGVTFSPDGARVAFVRWGDEVSSIMMANADGSDLQSFFSQHEEASLQELAWSPDGHRLAMLASANHGSAPNATKLKTISLEDKKVEPVGEKVWRAAVALNWSNDGTSLMFVAQEDSPAAWQVWSVSFPAGEERAVTTDFTDYSKISVISKDGLIAAERVEFRTSIWSLDIYSRDSRQITAERVDRAGGHGIAQMPDGSLLVTKRVSGQTNLWRLSGDSYRTEDRLTDQAADDADPTASPDGRTVLYSSKLENGVAIWKVDGNGKNAAALTRPGSKRDSNPTLLGDGRSILFIRSTDGYETKLMRTSLDGGPEQEVSFAPNVRVNYISVSRDGTLVSVVSTEVAYDSENAGPSVRFFVLKDEELVPLDRKVDPSQLGSPLNRFILTDDESLISNGATDIANLYFQARGSKEFAKMTDFKDGVILQFNLSNNGKQVFFVRQFRSTDIFLMKDKRGS
jgi:eukaryotic-like serine/threonine-protein kinase